jgi:hypothetical protein
MNNETLYSYMRGYLVAKLALTGEKINMEDEGKSMKLTRKVIERLDIRHLPLRGPFTNEQQVQAVMELQTMVDMEIAAWVNEAYLAVKDDEDE